MKGKIDSMLSDIYTLEPELRQHEKEVRALVTRLIKAKPEAAPDPAFIARLREEVLISVPRSVPQEATGRDLSWWVFHLAPIGVFAVLTIALVGDRAFAPTAMPTTPPSQLESESSQQDSTVAIERMAPASQGDDSATMMIDMGDAYGASDHDASLSLKSVGPTEDAAHLASGNSISSFDHASSDIVFISEVMLEAPGHVRVFAYQDGPRAVLGTSAVIGEGMSFQVPVTLTRIVVPGETLYAQLFISDGDDTFEPYEDVPARDADGNLIYTTFMIAE